MLNKKEMLEAAVSALQQRGYKVIEASDETIEAFAVPFDSEDPNDYSELSYTLFDM